MCNNTFELQCSPFTAESPQGVSADLDFDPNANLPWWVPKSGKSKWWQWVLFGIGVALVIAAAIILTIASYGATSGLLWAIAIGAAKGALIGAAIGVTAGIIGGAIYGAADPDADIGESILSGFLIGFGVGAIVGAVVGGTVGYYNYQPAQITGFTKHGINSVISKNGHGVNETALLDAIKNPNEIIAQAHRTKFKFIGKNATVILNKTGKVVTAWARHSVGWRIGLWL